MKNFKKNKGFTLIELLIVVAIIAILAAIAIPNFLAAQVRSKVARVHAEQRTLATAIESYMIDNTTYPINPQAGRNGIFGFDATPGDIDYTWMITTPIAYLSSYPKDPFNVSTLNPANGVGYFFYTYNEVDGGGPGWSPSATFTAGANHWAILSFGPDLMPEGQMTLLTPPVATSGATPWSSERQRGNDSLTIEREYDPSNGTVSYGEIYRTQMSGQL